MHLVVILFMPMLLKSSGLAGSLVIAGMTPTALLGVDVLMSYYVLVISDKPRSLATGSYGAAISTIKFGLPPLVGIVNGLILSLICATVVSRQI